MSVAPYEDTPIQPELDWEAYFEDFKARHGKPVPHGLRWLFPDGWTYSMTDFGGPEWAPPEDEHELRSLKVTWQKTMRRIIGDQYAAVQRIVSDLRELQETKSATIQQKIWTLAQDSFGDTYEVDSGRVKPISLEPLEMKMEELRGELSRLKSETDNGRRGS